MALSDYAIFPTSPAQNDLSISAISRKVVFPILRASADSGYMQRRAKWNRPLYVYKIDSTKMFEEERKKIVDFFMAHLTTGKDEFLFKDPFFYSVDKHVFGVGDGSETVYQLVIRHVYSGREFTYPARYIKENSETIYIDNVAQDPSTYNLDYETGVITFDTAPADSLELTASFEFYRKCILVSELELIHNNIISADSTFVLQEVL